ncbi:DUF3291 domain-containing protein [Tateyamaria omphalii]|uniref:DUF3291 domain-containing protein n=1 Tax=Tateyamaria omphalii TaxID=299262 RepID=A0A1P8MY45_9RHOB|nr:DUF3291 domain-containing protein [Tateyamaria omphalii]APX12953.1 hypothetical protein BWR18_15625 [Tateyamaria omphalii]
MSKHMLVHLNVVRPLGAFSASHPNAQFFFGELPKVFARAKADDGMFWHNHGARMPDGSYGDMNDLLSLQTDRTEDNFHILTMAGWRDAKAMHSFAYRDALHRDGMKTLRDWVDRSEGATMVLWWAIKGTRVALEDGWNKLQNLRSNGPSAEGFTLQSRFPPPD